MGALREAADVERRGARELHHVDDRSRAAGADHRRLDRDHPFTEEPLRGVAGARACTWMARVTMSSQPSSIVDGYICSTASPAGTWNIEASRSMCVTVPLRRSSRSVPRLVGAQIVELRPGAPHR